MASPVFRLEGIRVDGKQGPRIDDLSMQIEGGITAVIGPSGAGKTTLLNVLVGFEQPSSGRIAFDPPAPAGLPLYWAPFDHGLWPHLDCRQHLQTVHPEPAREQGVDDLLDAFDLSAQAEVTPDHLSQGQCSRLAVARALASQARVLVLDEPLVHIDPWRATKYWATVRKHVHATDSCLVFSTHSPQQVLAEAQNVACLQDGRLLYHGAVESLYYQPATEELAHCLGEANWIEPEELAKWLGPGSGSALEPSGCCLRPEQIQIVVDEKSPIFVRSSRFLGTLAEVELHHEGHEIVRRFLHRPAAQLPVGQRVAIKCRWLLLLLWSISLLLPWLGSCGQALEPELEFSEINHRPLPPDGSRQPAPRSIAPGQKGEWIVLDSVGRVLILDDQGKLLRQWRMPKVEVGRPEGVCLLEDGRIAVADTHYHRVVFFDQAGTLLGELGEYGKGPGQFIYPVKVIQDGEGFLYVAEYGSNDRVQKFAPDLTPILAFGSFGTGPGQFQRPSGLALKDGKIYVADAINNQIQVFTTSGEFVGVLGHTLGPPALKFPYDLCLGPSGLLYVVEYGAGRVTALTTEGAVIGRFGRTGSGPGQLATPWGIAVDLEGHIWVADTGNRRIVEFCP